MTFSFYLRDHSIRYPMRTMRKCREQTSGLAGAWPPNGDACDSKPLRQRLAQGLNRVQDGRESRRRAGRLCGQYHRERPADGAISTGSSRKIQGPRDCDGDPDRAGHLIGHQWPMAPLVVPAGSRFGLFMPSSAGSPTSRPGTPPRCGVVGAAAQQPPQVGLLDGEQATAVRACRRRSTGSMNRSLSRRVATPSDDPIFRCGPSSGSGDPPRLGGAGPAASDRVNLKMTSQRASTRSAVTSASRRHCVPGSSGICSMIRNWYWCSRQNRTSRPLHPRSPCSGPAPHSPSPVADPRRARRRDRPAHRPADHGG